MSGKPVLSAPALTVAQSRHVFGVVDNDTLPLALCVSKALKESSLEPVDRRVLFISRSDETRAIRLCAEAKRRGIDNHKEGLVTSVWWTHLRSAIRTTEL